MSPATPTSQGELRYPDHLLALSETLFWEPVALIGLSEVDAELALSSSAYLGQIPGSGNTNPPIWGRFPGQGRVSPIPKARQINVPENAPKTNLPHLGQKQHALPQIGELGRGTRWKCSIRLGQPPSAQPRPHSPSAQPYAQAQSPSSPIALKPSRPQSSSIGVIASKSLRNGIRRIGLARKVTSAPVRRMMAASAMVHR
jgi:hypothetical protein